jgi:hypothetical protein
MPDNADFYDRLPVFEAFADIMEPARYRPLPNDWLIGLPSGFTAARGANDPEGRPVIVWRSRLTSDGLELLDE